MSSGKILCLGFLVFWGTGCATTVDVSTEPAPRPSAQGIYHKVQKGETLWRIAKTYQVDLEQVIARNNIPDVAHVDEGQLILIPGASQKRDVPEIVLPAGSGKDEFVWPVKGRVVSYFGTRRGGYFNKGIWIQAEEGQTVVAARAGRVVFADHLPGYGRMVILAHGDGYLSVYARNADLVVRLGDRVDQGAPLARVGRNGNRPYLHFEIRRHGRADNPLYFLPRT